MFDRDGGGADDFHMRKVIDGWTHPIGPWQRDTATCTCYVRYCHTAARCALHRGCHDLDCAQYHESGDPVDALHDRLDREALHEIIARATRPPGIED